MTLGQITPFENNAASNLASAPDVVRPSLQGGGAASLGTQYLPEPSTTGMGMFRDVLQSVSGYAGDIVSAASGANVGGFDQLIAAQIQSQLEMQQVSLISNVEKSRHESKMAAIRNIRVG